MQHSTDLSVRMMGLGTPKVGMQSEKQLYFIVLGPMAPLFRHCHWPNADLLIEGLSHENKALMLQNQMLKIKKKNATGSHLLTDPLHITCRWPPHEHYVTTPGRYLYYADVCAFHHYPAWYPTHVPGNMDEVKQIPLIWEAGGKDLKLFRCFCCNYLWNEILSYSCYFGPEPEICGGLWTFRGRGVPWETLDHHRGRVAVRQQ